MNTTRSAARTAKGKQQRRDKQGKYRKPEKQAEFDAAVLKPQVLVDPKTNTIVAWIVFAVTLFVYFLTTARSLSFWDSGEFATCISTLGVPHPPGAAFYIVFGRALVSLFGGIIHHAFIASFLSGIFSAFAVMFTYLITVQLVSMLKVEDWHAIFAGCMAAFLTAFSFTFWMNAIEAEVYSGLVFFVNLIIWLTLRWVQHSEDMNRQNELLLIVYLFFLGFCVHQTALQIAPAILFIVVYPLFREGTKKSSFWPKVIGYTFAIIIGYVIFGAIGHELMIDDFDKWGFALVVLLLLWIELRDVFDKRLWFLAVVLVLLGISSHLYIPVRAAQRPFINEGHPSTWKMFTDYVLRKQYGETSFFVRRASFFGEQMGYHFLRYLWDQWLNSSIISAWLKVPGNLIKAISAIITGGLGILGAVFQARRNKHSFFYLLSLVFCTTILMVFVINLSNAEVRDRDYFFVVGYNMLAIWIGIGAMALVTLAKDKSVQIALMVVLGLFPIVNMASQYRVHDRSREFIALDYGLNFLNSLEENAIIFTNGDNDTFPIWYAQAVEDPYAHENIYPAKDVYPDEQTKAAIAEAMAFKNKELRGVRKDVTVANLSLLNTAWYIRQLQDREGVIINFTEDELDNLLSLQPPRELNVGSGEMSFSLQLDESPAWRPNERFYRISDLAVMQIIKDNFGKRPIYFAVTCESMIGFEDYVRAEGMVNRLVHTKSGVDEQVDIARLTKNIDKVYKYRSIHDDRVYKDDNMIRLVMNYAAAFSKAASHFAVNNQPQKAWQYAEKARSFKVDELRMIDFYVRYYANTRKIDEFDQYLERNLYHRVDGAGIMLKYVLQYLEEYDPQLALSYYEKALMHFPQEDIVARFAVFFADERQMEAQVADLLERYQTTLSYSVDPFIQFLRQPQE